jgi:hypothetical protein
MNEDDLAFDETEPEAQVEVVALEAVPEEPVTDIIRTISATSSTPYEPRLPIQYCGGWEYRDTNNGRVEIKVGTTELGATQAVVYLASVPAAIITADTAEIVAKHLLLAACHARQNFRPVALGLVGGATYILLPEGTKIAFRDGGIWLSDAGDTPLHKEAFLGFGWNLRPLTTNEKNIAISIADYKP